MTSKSLLITNSILLFFLLGCSHGKVEEQSVYIYTDSTGNYRQVIETKQSENRLVTRKRLFVAGGKEPVEKSISVARLKEDSSGIKLLPEAFDVEVWFNKKNYRSKGKTVSKEKAMYVKMDTPEENWAGTRKLSFPQGKRFCFFEQIPDCLRLFGYLNEENFQEKIITVVWDSYPFTSEIYKGVRKNLFTAATLNYEGDIEGVKRFVLQIDNQLVFYEFESDDTLKKMFWISQGITKERVLK